MQKKLKSISTFFNEEVHTILESCNVVMNTEDYVTGKMLVLIKMTILINLK